MSDQEFHEQYAEEFDEAVVAARGAVIGWCGGNGEVMPKLTYVQSEAIEHGFQEAFNAGVRAARKAAV